MTGKEIYVDIVEIKQPETDAQLVAENVALQLERRVSFRRAMKKALQTAKDFGAEGIKIRCAGRLGGAELARVEQYHWGRVPLHTLAGEHRLRLCRGQHGLWQARHQVLDLQGRDQAGEDGPAAAGRADAGEVRFVEKEFCYAIDARKSEVPQDAPRQPRRPGLRAATRWRLASTG